MKIKFALFVVLFVFSPVPEFQLESHADPTGKRTISVTLYDSSRVLDCKKMNDSFSICPGGWVSCAQPSDRRTGAGICGSVAICNVVNALLGRGSASDPRVIHVSEGFGPDEGLSKRQIKNALADRIRPYDFDRRPSLPLDHLSGYLDALEFKLRVFGKQLANVKANPVVVALWTGIPGTDGHWTTVVKVNRQAACSSVHLSWGKMFITLCDKFYRLSKAAGGRHVWLDGLS